MVAGMVLEVLGADGKETLKPFTSKVLYHVPLFEPVSGFKRRRPHPWAWLHAAWAAAAVAADIKSR